LEPDIGTRLRQVRIARGFSQRELARRVGVSNAAISLMEANKGSPSVSALKRVLDGLPMSLSEFFSVPPERSTRYFYRVEDMTEIGRGRISYRQLGDHTQKRALQILKETYSPGADSGRIPLTHEGEEGGVVITGRLEVTVGSQRRILTAGQGYMFDSVLPHRFRNVGSGPCEVVSACFPPTF
jgi:transcriptional regulator with XRE-family HTH domain